MKNYLANGGNADAFQKGEMLIAEGYSTMEEAEKKYVDNLLEGAKTVSTIQSLYGDQANTILAAMGNNLDQYDNLVNTLEGLNLSETLQKRFNW